MSSNPGFADMGLFKRRQPPPPPPPVIRYVYREVSMVDRLNALADSMDEAIKQIRSTRVGVG
jgi:hypothetical protein